MRVVCRGRLALVGGLGTLALFSAARAARAQENYEIEVYPSATVLPKTLVLESHSNYSFQGQKLSVDGVAPTYHAGRETVEATVGVAPWIEIGGYVFSNVQRGLGPNVVGGSVRPRVRVPDSWAWPLGLSLATEVEYARAAYSEDRWTWEIRPIIDRYAGHWYLSVNPTLECVWRGVNAGRGAQFAPSAKATYDFTQLVSAGVEYYALPGERAPGSVFEVDTIVVPVGGPQGPNAARAVDTDAALHIPHGGQQQFFAAVDLHLSPLWEINLGVGVGSTASTDHVMAKLILGRSFSWASMSPFQ